MTDIPQEILDVQELVNKHGEWRSRTLNMIASENAVSPHLRDALQNDWLGRYADFTGRDLDARRYRGTRYMVAIEKIVEGLARRVFRAEHVELRPTAGHIAGAAVVMALCKPGDTIFELSGGSGGHREATKFAMPALMDLDVQWLPFDGERYNVDAAAAADLFKETRPRLVILGSSNFLFPHPVREIRQALDEVSPDTVLVYDASHVLGLVAGGQFQDPLGEGADIVFSSTHKTFPGPQGGIIFTNRADLIEIVSDAIYPGLITNHHPFRMPGLATALAEMEAFGAEYAAQISANAQALGAALEENGVPCVSVDGVYSCSHTVLAKAAGLGSASDLALKLEEADIICTSAGLPEEQGGDGIRLGVQELTHHGMTEGDMASAAALIADVVLGRRPTAAVAEDVHALAGSFDSVRFTW
jgi:glycine hydroxymethyltransferase